MAASPDPESTSGHGPGGTGGHGSRAIIAALLANGAIATAKFVGFAITGASSMLAEAVHSVADSGNQALLLLGARRSRRAADDVHAFGYGRESYFWAFVVALVLFTMGSMFAIYEAVHKLGHPEPVQNPAWAFGILGFALVAEGYSFRTAVVETRKVKGDATYWQFIRRTKIPELPVVLLEDLGAMVGLLFALTGVGLAVITGDSHWDGYATLAIGILLGMIAIILVIEMKSLLIGESATTKELEAVHAAIAIDPDVIRVLHLRTQYLGPSELMLGAKVEMHHDLTLVEVADTVNRLERHVRAAVPTARYVYIEPDVHDDHRRSTTYVADHTGHIEPDDPRYAEITGRPVDPDDDIWVE